MVAVKLQLADKTYTCGHGCPSIGWLVQRLAVASLSLPYLVKLGLSFLATLLIGLALNYIWLASLLVHLTNIQLNMLLQ